MSWNESTLFGEREQPPMSAPLFGLFVVSRLRGAPGIEIESQRELELGLRVRGQPTTAYLEPYYRRYREDPAALSAIVQQFIGRLTTGQKGEEQGADADANSFASVAPHLLPLLMSSADWQQKRELGLRVVIRPLVQDLGVALVVDEPDAITYVEIDAVPRWGVDAASAYEIANANLDGLASGTGYSQLGEDEDTLLIDRASDGYAATRVILPSRLEEWSSRVPGELVLGLPHRDFLIGFSSEHPQLEALQAQVEADARTASLERALSPHLLVYRRGTLEIYDDR